MSEFSKFEYRDMFGREIKVGDYIVYSALADRSGVLRAGKVIELTHTKDVSYGRKAEPKIRARSWNNFRQESWENGTKTKDRSGRQKDVTLGFLDRVVVVPADTVSLKVRDDLEGPIEDRW